MVYFALEVSRFFPEALSRPWIVIPSRECRGYPILQAYNSTIYCAIIRMYWKSSQYPVLGSAAGHVSLVVGTTLPLTLVPKKFQTVHHHVHHTHHSTPISRLSQCQFEQRVHCWCHILVLCIMAFAHGKPTEIRRNTGMHFKLSRLLSQPSDRLILLQNGASGCKNVIWLWTVPIWRNYFLCEVHLIFRHDLRRWYAILNVGSLPSSALRVNR